MAIGTSLAGRIATPNSGTFPPVVFLATVIG
jgi:hypothetical protein